MWFVSKRERRALTLLHGDYKNLCLGDLAELEVALEEVMEQTDKMNGSGLPRLAFILLSCKGSS